VDEKMNNKYRLTAALLVSLFLLGFSIACGKKESQTDNDNVNAEQSDQIIEPLIQNSHPCNNIFYPMVLGNQWVYTLQAEGDNGTFQTSEIGLTVAEVSESNALLAALNYDSGIVTQSTVDCNDQAILNFPMTELNFILDDVAGDLQFKYLSGEFMPSESDFIDGEWKNSWKTEILATGTVSGAFDNNSATVTLSESPVSMEWQIIENDQSLTVIAGSFTDVTLVKRELSFDIPSLKANFRGQDVDISTTLKITTNMWFAPHIGLLKQEIESASINFFGINFPIDPIGTIELKSYSVVN
jgi:hypothetical protein